MTFETDSEMNKVSNGETKKPLHCTFCGKSQHEVRKLIAGPTVFICDECVELCMDIIGEENKSSLVKSRDGSPTPKEIRKVLDDYERRLEGGPDVTMWILPASMSRCMAFSNSALVMPLASSWRANLAGA
jgi:hypothetical protein